MSKKSVIAIGAAVMVIVAIAIVLSVTLPGRFGGVMVSRSGWSAINQTGVLEADSWGYTATRISGTSRRDIEFSAVNLANLRINSSNSGGSIRLTMTQGDIEEVIDLSGEFAGNVDASIFLVGRIRLSLRFDDVQNVNLLINWGN